MQTRASIKDVFPERECLLAFQLPQTCCSFHTQSHTHPSKMCYVHIIAQSHSKNFVVARSPISRHVHPPRTCCMHIIAQRHSNNCSLSLLTHLSSDTRIHQGRVPSTRLLCTHPAIDGRGAARRCVVCVSLQSGLCNDTVRAILRHDYGRGDSPYRQTVIAQPYLLCML
jgi:hypothetical protein